MAAQEYTVKSIKTTGQQDNNNNDMLWVNFEGIQDAALMFAQKHPEVEGKEYGEITTEKGKTSGKEYLRFRRKQREDGFHAQAPTQKKEWQPRDDEAIKAQWALGRAYEKHGATETAIKEASWLIEAVDRVKHPKAEGVYQEKTGYDAFKKAADTVKERVEEVTPVEAYADVQVEEIDDTPIDLSEIPF